MFNTDGRSRANSDIHEIGSALLREFLLNRGDQLGRVGFNGGLEAGGDGAVFGDDEFLKVPAHIAGKWSFLNRHA